MLKEPGGNPAPFPLEPAERSDGPEPKMPGNGMAIPIVLFLISVLLWESWLIYPVKILTVFFHELSHGLAAKLTGGQIMKIVLTADEGGVCYTLGGNRILILSAGYLGSLLWGSALFLAASLTRYDRAIVKGLGGLLLLITLVYVPWLSFGFFFGLVFGGGMIALSNQFGEAFCDQFLRYIGLTSSLYVILDIKDDLIDRSVAISDASKLAEILHLPGWVIGGVWFLLALFISYKAVLFGWKVEEKEPPSSEF